MYYLKMIGSEFMRGLKAGNLSTLTAIVSLLMAVIFGLYIYYIYRINCRNGFYDSGFNKSLAILPAITAGIMLGMQSNVLLSLGMVGALSIVRFRNAVKNSIDLVYLFWSISIGIVIGVGLYKLAILLSLCVNVLIFGLDLLPGFRAPYIFVLTGDKSLQEQELLTHVKKYSSALRIRSRNVSSHSTEWILELRTKNPAELVSEVSALEGVHSANLLSHDGDVRY